VDEDAARELFSTARVARLATIGADGRPHQVPVCFALEGSTLLTAVDHKPKRTLALRRLANVAANPRVSLLADHYEEDWSRLWWVRADGVGHLAEAGTREHGGAVEAVRGRYEQYRQRPPQGPAIVIDVERWSGWRAV
jgi:PPOX class probable F420-dependent enzyme